MEGVKSKGSQEWAWFAAGAGALAFGSAALWYVTGLTHADYPEHLGAAIGNGLIIAILIRVLLGFRYSLTTGVTAFIIAATIGAACMYRINPVFENAREKQELTRFFVDFRAAMDEGRPFDVEIARKNYELGRQEPAAISIGGILSTARSERDAYVKQFYAASLWERLGVDLVDEPYRQSVLDDVQKLSLSIEEVEKTRKDIAIRLRQASTSRSLDYEVKVTARQLHALIDEDWSSFIRNQRALLRTITEAVEIAGGPGGLVRDRQGQVVFYLTSEQRKYDKAMARISDLFREMSALPTD